MHSIQKFGIIFGFVLAMACQPGFAVRAQSVSNDSSSMRSDSSSAGRNTHQPVYHVNYWVSGPIILVGAAGGLYWLSHGPSNITNAELAAVNPNDVPFFDRISLHQNMALVPTWDGYATIGQKVGALMPLLILLDPDVRPDWLNVLTIGLEVNMVTLGIYTITPLGPHFITRYRPLVYYPLQDANAAGINQADGNNKASFYSGHVASVTCSAMFIAKVYCDYHPDASEYAVYGLAAVPSLGMGVIRFMTLDHFPSDIAVGLAVGTVCGVVIPQLHRIGGNGLSMGMYSSPTSTGLTLTWDIASE